MGLNLGLWEYKSSLATVMLYEVAARQDDKFVTWSVGGIMQVTFEATIGCSNGIFFLSLWFRWQRFPGVVRRRQYVAAQGRLYMLVCKSCCPKLSRGTAVIWAIVALEGKLYFAAELDSSFVALCPSICRDQNSFQVVTCMIIDLLKAALLCLNHDVLSHGTPWRTSLSIFLDFYIW